MDWKERFKRLRDLKKQQTQEEKERISNIIKQVDKVADYFSDVIEDFADILESTVDKSENVREPPEYSKRWEIHLGEGYLHFTFYRNGVEVGYWLNMAPEDLGRVNIKDIKKPDAKNRLAKKLEKWFLKHYGPFKKRSR